MVRIRAQIPVQMHLYHQILVQQESLEVGLNELKNWLDKADEHLSKYSLSNDPEELKENLNKHKQFFNRTLYYK